MKSMMYKMVLVLLFVFVLFTTSSLNTIDANTEEVEEQYPLFSETITLDNNKRTKVDVGFVTVVFKKNFLPKDMYPITFDIEVYAEDGKVYIEFSPDVDEFLKDVVIKVNPYEGYIYDKGVEDYILVDIPRLKMKVPHFSRWCFVW